ncbi:MAG: LOG family protein [Candidatus Omnitrophica bacterium]|nr:LOG family protein [Candidatus Omnitrophota bacterium]MBI2174493.1 LOG family protein [Candidatus Omnitrophota bacterium]MBI3010084.1 LOG family protein [Candidatus Omnitrophota bacterium]
MIPNRPLHPYTTHKTEADSQIAALLQSLGEDRFDRRLLSEMMVSIYRLGEDAATTGDLKILNAALKELRYAFRVFRPYRSIRKVALFGSARVSRGYPGYQMAKAFGHRMAQADWMVITGAASGIMKAGHEGAGCSASFGLNIRLPFEQEANPIIAKDQKLVNCKYFFTRKLLFIKESHATALFPGGFGTLDEGFESMTLVQTGKSDPRPIVLVDLPDGTFWKPLLSFIDQRLAKGGMISRSDCSIYKVARSAEEAARHILHFYSTYHSLRYVERQLVLRLTHPLAVEAPAKLTREFRDIIETGTIRQTTALPEEADEPSLKDLPRLIFAFNRKQFGRLIEMIHRINELGNVKHTG